MSNGLWYYHDTHGNFVDYPNPSIMAESSTVCHLTKLSSAAQYELFHQYFGHPGERVMQQLHQHVDGVPLLRGNSFYKCLSCIHAKMSSRNTTSSTPHPLSHSTIPPLPCLLENGQQFHMDFGFMRGSTFAQKDTAGCLLTSIDGFRSYLLIIC
jgi:hypothetical protein